MCKTIAKIRGQDVALQKFGGDWTNKPLIFLGSIDSQESFWREKMSVRLGINLRMK